ncbi:MAG: nicotinate phosphoribosyltransferase [Blastocatellia bacterium]|nr:nicotinate phosphoribosyltransferase [Blastocatellia bacterium]
MAEDKGKRKREARGLGLATDLYQLTMAAGYLGSGRNERASFELFVRRLPDERSYLIAAGLSQALDYLKNVSFGADEVEYLQQLPTFAGVSQDFFDYLRDFRFSGDVWAMPEGSLFFAGEPLLRITAPLIEAQIVETFLLATINFQTSIASKAARIVEAAQGRGVIEFGARRCHGFEAAIYAARAAFIGGCIGTSNVEAGKLFDIPLYGTSAHSFVMAFAHEIDAFRAYHKVFPESTTLLLDTYDTIAAAHLATEFGTQLKGVRLDSGDLVELSNRVRAILDGAGMHETQILASGDLNEEKIDRMLAAGAQIDLFGVGTELSTSRDAPALGGVYKLVEIEYDGRTEPKMKLSREKSTYPSRKQVWRSAIADGSFKEDVIASFTEADQAGQPLLIPVMRGGEIVGITPGLREMQEYAKAQLERLPSCYKRLRDPESYRVSYSPELDRLRWELTEACSWKRN